MTLAQLKRDIQSGAIKALQTVEFNGVAVPDEGTRLSGVRKVMTVQTNAFSLLTDRGTESWVEYPKAKQLEYTGDFLRIYYTADNDRNRSQMYKVYR